MTGPKDSFHIVSRDSDLRPAEVTNYKSATGDDVRDKVDQAIREEINRGNYTTTTEKPTIVSALGAIPKPDSDKTVLSTTAADRNIAMLIHTVTRNNIIPT